MPKSATDIANQALVHLGSAPPFLADVTTDQSKPGRLLNQSLEVGRQSVLRLHPWNFAKKRATISAAVVSGAANNGGGLIRITTAAAHGFATNDSVKVVAVGGVPAANGTWVVTVINPTTFDLVGSAFAGTYTSGGYAARSISFEFQWGLFLPAGLLRVLSVDGDPRTEYQYEDNLIVTNDTTHQLAYITDVTDYTKMTSAFYQALALYYAWMISYALTESTSIRDNMWSMFNSIVKKERFIDSTEDPMKELDAPTLIEARQSHRFPRDPWNYK